MKRTIVAILLMSIFLCGCSTSNSSSLKHISDEIVRCFDEKDAEGLKNMFCRNSIVYYDIDSEIQNAFDLYEGQSVSYKIYSNGGWSGGYDNGICVDKHSTPEIRNIKTNCGKKYTIGYCTYEVYEKDAGRVGIGVIGLQDEEGNEIAVIGGYGWK